MARKKTLKTFRAVKAVKELARERIGSPRAERIAPDGKKRAKRSKKHKPTLAQLLGADNE